MSVEQLPLFPPTESTGAREPGDPAPSGLSARSTLGEAIQAFHRTMPQKGFTRHTINSFYGDLRILQEYLGAGRPLARISTKNLSDFLHYLLVDRGRPCNPKSYARRLTTLKVFFDWLVQTGVLASDPAAPLVHLPVSTPLPQTLSDGEVEKLLAAAQSLRTADKPDARPLLLVQLLLTTGIKKAECMAVKLSDIDLTDPHAPVLYIRYAHPRRRHKERKLNLGPSFAAVLQEYRSQYHPQINLFECTNRNLEYVLRDLRLLSGVDTPVSFESLRMTCAVRDYRRGVPLETLRAKLGLSHISWEDTSQKIQRLATAAL